MRVWVFDGPRQVRVETRPVPEPGSGEVRVQVARAGICGSDSHGYAGESGTRRPGVVMGHEVSGRVDALGPGVEGLEPGEPVTICPTLPCDGSCGHASANRCLRLRIMGVNPDAPGGFADYVVVPADRVVRLGGLSYEQGALVEPMAVGLHAARRAGVGPGQRVLVLGGGMVGHAAAWSARLEGAAEVVVSEPDPGRRAVAAAAGFATVGALDPGGPAEFDQAIDAVGIPATVAAAIGAVRKGGVACLVGLGQPVAQLRVPDVVTFERSIVGSAAYTDTDFHDALAAIADGRFDLTNVRPRVVTFDELGQALESIVSGAETALKVTMTTGLS